MINKVLTIAISSCLMMAFTPTAHAQDKLNTKAELVAEFNAQQVTGVSVSSDGRVFANFPKWRDGVENDVVEVLSISQHSPYPNEDWNSWTLGDPIDENKFISVQSVVAHNQKLYVLDTANPKFAGVLTSPRLFVFDLASNALVKAYSFEEGVYKPKSYFNDLRVDDKKEKIYITDSSQPGLIILDVKSGDAARVLDNTVYTQAEQDHLIIEGKKWGKKPVHSDGIALDVNTDVLYIHALTGHTLYGFQTGDLLTASPKPVVTMKTAAPDGMIVDQNGHLYFADLEAQKIQYLDKETQKIETLLDDKSVISWADTFSILGCDLYYTNSRIHESKEDVSDLVYSIYKTDLPDCD